MSSSSHSPYSSSSSSTVTQLPAAAAVVPFSHSIIAGGIAGMTELTAMYPLDVVKTRAMAGTGRQENMFVVLGRAIKNEHIHIYRGMLFPLLSETPKRALKFSANSQLRDTFGKYGYNGQTLALMSGIGAGICEGAIVCSPELIKIRMQLPDNKGLYTSSMQAAGSIIRQEGVGALFTGLGCTVLRNACWNGTYFGSIFAIKAALSSTIGDGKSMNFIAGTIAGSLGCCVNTPLDVVKTRMQNLSALKQARPMDADKLSSVPSRTVPLLMHIVRTEGITALWKGLAPKILRLGPGGGIMLVVYEQVTAYLGDRAATAATAAATKTTVKG